MKKKIIHLPAITLREWVVCRIVVRTVMPARTVEVGRS